MPTNMVSDLYSFRDERCFVLDQKEKHDLDFCSPKIDSPRQIDSPVMDKSADCL